MDGSCPGPGMDGGSLFSGSYYLIDFDGAHQEDDEKHEAEKTPGPAHILLDDREHDDCHQKDSGYFIPDPQLCGGKTEYALCLLFINDLEGEVIEVKPQHKA